MRRSRRLEGRSDPPHFKRHGIEDLQRASAVALLGPRQAGKTTLAWQIAKTRPSLYLDLQSEADRVRLASPELHLADQADQLVILDATHHLPGLFPVLRGLIDRARRARRKAGRYPLLRSASIGLLRQSGESLAGRIAYLELSPLMLPETVPHSQDAPWLRGGFTRDAVGRNDRVRDRFLNGLPLSRLPRTRPRACS